MTIDNGVRIEHLGRTAEIVALTANLPAVATNDWCMRAAEAISRIRSGAIGFAMVASTNDKGFIHEIEASGAYGRDMHDAPVIADAIRMEGSGSLDWWLENGGDGPIASLLRAQPVLDSFWNSPSGRRWWRLGASDLIVGFAPIGPRSLNRYFIAEVGALRNNEFTRADAAVLRAVLGPIGARAELAFGQRPVCPNARITAREQEVLLLLTHGHSVKDIAEKLGRSPHTVHDHVKSLHRKLNASSRGELVARALGCPEVCASNANADEDADLDTSGYTDPLRNGDSSHAHAASA